ncbi:MAG: hypothetical protein ACRD3W_04815, partial [Terriglobales bacterium]
MPPDTQAEITLLINQDRTFGSKAALQFFLEYIHDNPSENSNSAFIQGVSSILPDLRVEAVKENLISATETVADLKTHANDKSDQMSLICADVLQELPMLQFEGATRGDGDSETVRMDNPTVDGQRLTEEPGTVYDGNAGKIVVDQEGKVWYTPYVNPAATQPPVQPEAIQLDADHLDELRIQGDTITFRPAGMGWLQEH